MGTIQVLPFSVANRIAAGEVVERPASAVKELVENAMDADARHITVEIQHGGLTFMRVSDDGCGMSEEDLAMCIRRHATSKIISAADLNTVLTMGFRGEALAAISAVCEMRIMSRQRDAEMGNLLEASQGNIVRLSETGCMVGTTVIVEELFACVPARRKFMRRDATEAQVVISIVEKLALARPDIAFRLIVDGNTKLQTAGDGDLKAAIYATLGKEFANRMIAVTGNCDGVTMTGYISRPDLMRGTRSAENFFINRRYIRSAPAAAALEQAYHSFMAAEKFPACVLHLTMNPESVDFNVHPSKLEVKFSRESAVFTVIYTTVRSALSSDVTRPELQFGSRIAASASTSNERQASWRETQSAKRRVSDAFVPVRDRRVDADLPRGEQLTLAENRSVGAAPMMTSDETPLPARNETERAERAERTEKIEREEKAEETVFTSPAPVPTPPAPATRLITAEEYAMGLVNGRYHGRATREVTEVCTEQTDKIAETAETAETTEAAEMEKANGTEMCESVPPAPPAAIELAHQDKTETQAVKPWRIVGQVFHSYIIVERENTMLLIDQHAAHERLLYEQLRTRLHEVAPASQPLIVPLEVMMMSDEVAAVCEYRAELEQIGFSFTARRNTLDVTALPDGVDRDVAADMLCTIAERIGNNTGTARLTRDIIFERALYQGACKAAIKAGRVYPEGHLEWLVEQLMRLPDITVCPHGRPVAMQMSKQHIDHQFERS